MKREDLEKLELTEEQIKAVKRLNGIDVNAEIDKANAVQQQLNQLQAKFDAQEQTIKDLKRDNADNDKLQQRIESLESDLAQQTEANRQIQLKNGIERKLIEAGALNVDDAMALIDKEALKLNDDGTVTGVEIQVENLKNRPHLASLFGLGQEPKPVEELAIQPGNISPKSGETPKFSEKSIGQQMAEQLLGQQKSSYWGNGEDF